MDVLCTRHLAATCPGHTLPNSVKCEAHISRELRLQGFAEYFLLNVPLRASFPQLDTISTVSLAALLRMHLFLPSPTQEGATLDQVCIRCNLRGATKCSLTGSMMRYVSVHETFCRVPGSEGLPLHRVVLLPPFIALRGCANKMITLPLSLNEHGRPFNPIQLKTAFRQQKSAPTSLWTQRLRCGLWQLWGSSGKLQAPSAICMGAGYRIGQNVLALAVEPKLQL